VVRIEHSVLTTFASGLNAVARATGRNLGRMAEHHPDAPAEAGALSPAQGLCVLHLFLIVTPETDRSAVERAVAEAEGEGTQVVTVAMLGHKGDIGIMALAQDLPALRRLQTALTTAGLALYDSYLSLTEVSEYAKGIPEAMLNARLYPQLPPDGKRAFCFYPMSKKRESDANWYTTDFEERLELMHEHGKSGRNFAGRVLQVVTGSTGLDQFEWGVTLFAQRPDDLKEVVYTMRFDRASAVFAEFGDFYTGYVEPIGPLMDSVGL
jgi:chlorite dismutase